MKELLLSVTPQGQWTFTLLIDSEPRSQWTSPNYASVIYVTKLWLEWSNWSVEKCIEEFPRLNVHLEEQQMSFMRGKKPKRRSL